MFTKVYSDIRNINTHKYNKNYFFKFHFKIQAPLPTLFIKILKIFDCLFLLYRKNITNKTVQSLGSVSNPGRPFLHSFFWAFLGNLGLNQIVDGPTWTRTITGVVKESLLDHIYLTNPYSVCELNMSWQPLNAG